MIRALLLLGLLGLVIAAATWLSDNPGSLTAEWRGYRIETSAALVVAAVALIAFATALIYRFWLALRRTPRRIADAWRERRRRRGYQALTRGMVAVAAGDPTEARKQAKRAEVLLNEPPLTMLLSAQSAQLGGDDRAAETFFTAMTERSETEFLGLRGLLSQAMKQNDRPRALELARRAYRLQPDSEWVAKALFDLQVDAGLWLDAGVTNDELARRRLLPGPQAGRRKAVLTFEQSRHAEGRGDRAEEFRLLRKANDLVSDFVPVTVRLAHCLAQDGKGRKAAGLIEKAWSRMPHPDLFAAHLEIADAPDALQTVKAAEKLVRQNASHPESKIALAQASVDAGLWGEARRHLSDVVDGDAKDGYLGRACRLMAIVEEKENDDLAASREWLVRAANAGPDRTWVCGDCGNSAGDWAVRCGNCGGFDTYSWGTPPHVGRLIAPGGETGETKQFPSPGGQ
ncbi:MAG: heme biosynthesis HemY N-terminal domain-containing protein [Rhodospirillaceae bacterium]